MPLKLCVGLSRKVGLPDYGSLGASCQVELELDNSLLQTDLDSFQRHVRDAYVACGQAVSDELARQRASENNSDNNTAPAATTTAAEEESLQVQALGLLGAYLGVLDENEPPPLAVETCLESPLVDPTTGEDLGIKLLGIVDLVLPGPDTPVIIDFKTAGKSAAPIMLAHEIQLAAYAYLFRSVTGERESELQIRSLVKTKTPKIAVHTYPSRGEVHFRRLFAVIREYLDALDRGVFNYRPSWSCGSCDFREQHCQQWSG